MNPKESYFFLFLLLITYVLKAQVNIAEADLQPDFDKRESLILICNGSQSKRIASSFRMGHLYQMCNVDSTKSILDFVQKGDTVFAKLIPLVELDEVEIYPTKKKTIRSKGKNDKRYISGVSAGVEFATKWNVPFANRKLFLKELRFYPKRIVDSSQTLTIHFYDVGPDDFPTKRSFRSIQIPVKNLRIGRHSVVLYPPIPVQNAFFVSFSSPAPASRNADNESFVSFNSSSLQRSFFRINMNGELHASPWQEFEYSPVRVDFKAVVEKQSQKKQASRQLE